MGTGRYGPIGLSVSRRPYVSLRSTTQLSPEQSSEPERAIDARGRELLSGASASCLRPAGFLLMLLLMWLHSGPRFCAAGSLCLLLPPRDIQVGRAHDLRKPVS